ncbi:21581_t:CDS:2, partial [Gigaspora margarita]
NNYLLAVQFETTMPKPSALKRQQNEKINVARSIRQATNTTQSKNLIDLSLSEKYESNNSNRDDDSDNDFVDNDELGNDEDANSIIDRLLAASKASFEKKGQPKLYTGLSARTCQRKNKALKEAAARSLKITSFFCTTNTQLLATDDNEDTEDYGSSEKECDDDESEDDNESEDNDEPEDDNESEDNDKDEEFLINNTIEFVNKIMNKKMLSKTLSKTKKTHYTSVLYFFRLLLDGQGKMEASETVAKESIPPSLRGKLPTKSPLHDEFVSLHLAAYLQTQKFKATPELSGQLIGGYISSVFATNVIKKRPDVVAYHQTFLEELAQLDRFMPKWLDQDCRIRTFLQLNDRPLKDDQEEARVMMVLGANQDGYWDSAKLFEQVRKAIPIFERTHPECVGVFAFDNATSHTAFAENALVASKMNLNPGSSAPKMRDMI